MTSRLVDLLGKRALLQHQLDLPGAPRGHPVADEPVANTDGNADLAQSLANHKRCLQGLRRGRRAAHDFEQAHDIRRTEEVHADDAPGSSSGARDLIDIQR